MTQRYTYHYNFTKKQKRYLKVKRLLDIIFAILLLILTAPIMLLAIIWIKCESTGDAIFRQKRPGYHQKIFTIYKLRSMRVDVTKDGKALTDAERTTKSGRFIRKTSIDELPQLVNIIKGEMSFIGPRPFLINDLEKYNNEQLIRFEVLPGITSWTAIHGRNNIAEQDKFNYEIYYVKNIGFRIDFQIFIKTIALVLSGKDVIDNVNERRLAAEIKEEIK